MTTYKKIITLSAIILAYFFSTAVIAGENRYQAHWNGKSYLIVDSDDGHLWTYRNDSMVYIGKVDGSEFEPPTTPQMWQQSHGKWIKNN